MKAPAEVQFAQKLAANEKTDRDKAVKKLKKWLGSRTDQLNEEEMMRIWKGLYYCYWMSDKMLVQEELAENISSMISCFGDSQSSLMFFKCFVRTFGREWFGIDQWRMNKFMMFVRRFLRHTFRFLSSKSWDLDLVSELRTILKMNLILCPPSDTSLGFQLHVTDVFLEELAKVGGDDLETEVLDLILEPYVELVVKCKEERLRRHVVERIFKHLVRQSDPGIDWEMEEDEEIEEDEMEEGDYESGDPSTIDNIDTNGSTIDNVDTNGEEVSDDEENDAEDPRAGNVDVVIPQIPVDYSKWAVKLFDLGSGKGVKKANREDLYNISKMFKDVASGVFPLGPNIDDQIEIPKISAKKSIKDIMKSNEQYFQQNSENKEEHRKLKKNSEKSSPKDEREETEKDNEIQPDVEPDEIIENQPGEESEDEVENQQESDLPKKSSEEQKLKRKDSERKRKAALKKRKREAVLKIQKENEDKQMKVQELLNHDINTKSEGDHTSKKDKIKKRTITESNTLLEQEETDLVPKKKKKTDQLDKTMNDENSLKVKKKKRKSIGKSDVKLLDLSSVQLNVSVEKNVPLANTEVLSEKQMPLIDSEKAKDEEISLKAKKKKRKSIDVNLLDLSSVQLNESVENNVNLTKTEVPSEKHLPLIDSEKSKDSTKKKKKNKSEANTPAKLEGKENVVKEIETQIQQDQSISDKSIKKMKKIEKKKQMYRVDSDVSFGTLSMSAVNLLDKSKEKEVKKELLPNISEDEPAVNTTLTIAKENQELSIKPLDDTPKKKKKGKLGRYNAETSLLITKSDPKVFDEPNDWDAPLLSGESEIVLPNKKYKGAQKLEEKVSVDTTEDPKFQSPTITPVKSFSGTFVKKAMSKTVTPKKKTKNMFEEKSMTDPRKKKINFMLTKNKEQELSDHLMSVKKSPQIPHNPDKNPIKTVLKKRKSLESGTKLNPVQLNTQLNSRSKAGKMLVKQRRKSSMFF